MKQVAEELSTSEAQVYALVRNQDLPAVKIGGRGQWRIERARFEEWIQQLYRDTEHWIREHPFVAPTETTQAAADQQPQSAPLT